MGNTRRLRTHNVFFILALLLACAAAPSSLCGGVFLVLLLLHGLFHRHYIVARKHAAGDDHVSLSRTLATLRDGGDAGAADWVRLVQGPRPVVCVLAGLVALAQLGLIAAVSADKSFFEDNREALLRAGACSVGSEASAEDRSDCLRAAVPAVIVLISCLLQPCARGGVRLSPRALLAAAFCGPGQRSSAPRHRRRPTPPTPPLVTPQTAPLETPAVEDDSHQRRPLLVSPRAVRSGEGDPESLKLPRQTGPLLAVIVLAGAGAAALWPSVLTAPLLFLFLCVTVATGSSAGGVLTPTPVLQQRVTAAAAASVFFSTAFCLAEYAVQHWYADSFFEQHSSVARALGLYRPSGWQHIWSNPTDGDFAAALACAALVFGAALRLLLQLGAGSVLRMLDSGEHGSGIVEELVAAAAATLEAAEQGDGEDDALLELRSEGSESIAGRQLSVQEQETDDDDQAPRVFVLRLTVLRCDGLHAEGGGSGGLDPYAQLDFTALSGSRRLKTPVDRRTHTPEWNHEMPALVAECSNEVRQVNFVFTVFNYHIVEEHGFLGRGEVTLPLSRLRELRAGASPAPPPGQERKMSGGVLVCRPPEDPPSSELWRIPLGPRIGESRRKRALGHLTVRVEVRTYSRVNAALERVFAGMSRARRATVYAATTGWRWTLLHSARLLAVWIMLVAFIYPSLLSLVWICYFLASLAVGVARLGAVLGALLAFSIALLLSFFVTAVPGVDGPGHTQDVLRVVGMAAMPREGESAIAAHAALVALICVTFAATRLGQLRQQGWRRNRQGTAASAGPLLQPSALHQGGTEGGTAAWTVADDDEGRLRTMARVARKGARIVLGALLRRTHYINLLLLLVAGFYAVDILSTGFLLFLFSFAVSPALAERAWPVLLAYEILAFFAFYSFHAIYRSPTAFDPPSHFGKLRSETLGLRTYDTTWSLLPYVALITCSLAQWAVYRMLRARREENQRKREIRRQLLACTQQPHRSLSDFRVGEPVVHCVRGQGRVDLIDAEESRIAIRFLEDGERHFYDAEKLHDGRLQPAAPTAPLTSPDGRLSRGSIQTEDAEEAAAKRLHLRRMRYQMKFVASLLLGYGFYVGIALFSSLTMISAVYMLFLIALTLIVAFSSNRAKWLTTVWVTTIVYSCAAMVVMYMYQFVSLREPFADVVNAVLDCDNAAPTMTLPVQSGTAALHDGDDSSSWKLRTQCMNQLGLRTFGDDSFAGMKSRALAMLPHYAAFAIALYQLKILPSVTSSSELERAGGGLGQAARGSKRVIVIGAPYLLAGLLFVASTHGYGNDHEGSLLSAGYFLFAVWHSFTMLSHAHAAVFFTVCVLLLKFWVQFKTFPHAWFSERSLRYFGLERICEHDDVERCKKSMADTVWWDMLAFLAAMLQHQSRVWLATMAESEFLCASAMRSQLTLVSYDSAEGGAEGEQGEVTSRPQDAPASPQSPRRPFVPVWLSGAVQRGLRRCAFAIDFGFTLYGFEAVMLVLLIVAVARPFRVYALCFAVMLLAWRNSRLSYSHAHALNASAQGLGIANATLALLFCTLQQALFVGLPEATVDSIGVPFAACEDNSARCKHLRYFALYPVADDLWACFAVFFVTVRFCVVHREVSAPGYRGHGRIDRAALCAQYDGAVTLAAYLDSGHREELLELLATPEVQLRRPRPGMYIRMVPAAFETPTGSVQLHEAYSGQVVSADGTDMVILWNDPTDGGPPWRVTGQDFPRRRVEPQDWWSSGGRPRRDALRDLAGILPRPLRGHNFIVHPRGITDRVRALWMMALPGLIILLIFIDSTRNEYVTVFRAGKLFGALYLTVAWGDLKWRGDRVWYYMNSYYILLLFLHLVWEVPGAADQQQAGVQLVGFASHDGGPVRTDALEVVIMSLMYLQRVNMDSFDFVYVLWEAFLHELHARDNAERCAAVRKQRKRLALERQLEAAQDRDENLRRTRQLVSALERELCDAVAGDTDAMNVSRPGNNLRSKVRFDLMPTWYEHPDDVSPRRAASPDPPSPPSPKPHVPPLVFPVVVTPAPVGRCTSSGAQQLTTPDVTFTASDPDVVTALEQVSPRAPPGGSAAGDDDEAADTMPMVHTRLAQRIGGRSMDQADGIGDLRRRHTRAAAAAAALVAATAGAVSQTPLAVRAAISVQRKALLGRRDLHPAHPDMRRGSLFAWGIALDGMLLLAIEETHLICATIFAVNFAVSASFADLIPSAASFVYALVANPGPNRMWWTFCLIWYTTVLFVKCILQALSLTVISKSAGTDSEAVRWLFGHLSQTFFENVLFDFFAIVSIFVHCHCLAWMGQGLDAVRQKHHRVVSDAGSGSDSDTAENRSRESFARSRSRASTRLSGPSQAARTARSGAISIASTKVMRQLQFGKLLPWNWSPRAAAIAFAHFVTATMSPHRRKSQLETQDLHTLCMGLDFLVFLLFAAFYSILQGQSGFKIASDISQNLVPGPLVLICFGLFLSILTERVIYLTKSIRAKCVSQLVQVLLFHLAYFLWWNETALTEGAHAAGAILFLVKALWLGLSAYQIRTGYPDPTEGNQDCFTMRPLSYFWGFLYMILRAIPLVWEFRVILDWCAANTTLSMKEWLQLEDVRYELYITRQTIRDKQVSNPHIGSATPFVDKVLGGWSIVAGLSLLVFFPLMYYSSFSPLLHSNTVSEISLSLRFDNTPPFYSERLLVPPEKRYKNETFAQALANTRNSARKLEVTNDDKKVQLLQLSANSAELWPITRPAVNNLADLLNSATPPAIIATVEVTRTSGDPAALDLRESSSYRLDLPWRNDTRERLVHVIATANTNGTAEAILPGFFSPWFLSRPLTLEINNTMPYQDCLLGINSSGAEGSTFWSFRCRSLFRHGNEPSPDDVPGDYDRGDPGCSAPECFPYVPAYGVAVSDLVNDTNGFLAGIGIVAFYVTFVLAVGRVIRDAATGGSHFIPLRCMANPLPVAMLAEHVHLARRAGDRELEEELWTLLVNLLRSPETVLRLTGLRGRRFAPRANPRI